MWIVRLSVIVFGLVVLLACSDDKPPPGVPFDAGPGRDAGDRDGGGEDDDGGMGMDGSIDGGGDDAGNVDAAGLDAAGRDAGEMDAGFPVDGGPPGDAAACVGLPFRMDCTTSIECQPAWICVNTGCGATGCVPGGVACASDTDCPTGATCTMNIFGAHCAAATCTDSRACPDGHTCEGGACVDRRIVCNAMTPCPRGFVCTIGTHGIQTHCVPVTRRCSGRANCGLRPMCVDVDGDGASECSAPGACTTNSDCTGAGQVCGPSAGMFTTECGALGPCRTAADCAGGHDCLDLWGDGVRTCVPSGGTCTRASDCAMGVCAVPAAGGPPTCVGTLI